VKLLKPSERRALEAEKRAQREAAEREKYLEKRSSKKEAHSCSFSKHTIASYSSFNIV